MQEFFDKFEAGPRALRRPRPATEPRKNTSRPENLDSQNLPPKYPENTEKIPRKYPKSVFLVFFQYLGGIFLGFQNFGLGVFFRYSSWKFRVGPFRGPVGGRGVLNQSTQANHLRKINGNFVAQILEYLPGIFLELRWANRRSPIASVQRIAHSSALYRCQKPQNREKRVSESKEGFGVKISRFGGFDSCTGADGFAISERGQLSQGVPQFHVERILHQRTPIARFESQRNERRVNEDQFCV